MESCDGCKYWSELLAQSIGLAPVEAMCLNPKSIWYGRYTVYRKECGGYEEGTPIDMPDGAPTAVLIQP